MVGVVVVGVVIITTAVIVGGDGVGNEVEEGVTQESPRGKAEQDLEKGGVVMSVLDRDTEQDEEWGCTDESCGDKGIAPQLPGALEGGGERLEEVPLRRRAVAMGPHQQWQQHY